MIQRIQTVFLFLSIVALSLFLWLPLIVLEAKNYTEIIGGWDVRHFYAGYIYFVNPILVGTAIALTLVNIFLYSNRRLQMLFCWLSILFIVSAQAYVFYKYETKIFIGEVYLTKWNILSIVAILLQITAFAYIRKDETMIKNLDRLR